MLDLSSAYLQLPLEEESKQYVTINTHKGLFKYNRLPFGIASAPGNFPKVHGNPPYLQAVNGVSVYINDILVTGSSVEDHLHNLEEVLQKAQEKESFSTSLLHQ